MTSQVFLQTEHTGVALPDLSPQPPGLDARLAPNSALRSTDRQSVTLVATATDAKTSQTYTRTMIRDVQIGAPTSWRLPDPLGPVTFETTAERLTATWSTLPDHDEILLFRQGFPMGPVRLQQMTLSRSFLEATRATSATLDFHAIPGFQSQWQPDPADLQIFVLRADRHVSATETALSAAGKRVNPSSPRTPVPAAVEPGATSTSLERLSWDRGFLGSPRGASSR